MVDLQLIDKILQDVRLLDQQWDLPDLVTTNRKADLRAMIDTLGQMRGEASLITQDDAKALAELLGQVGIHYRCIFAKYQVSRAGELTKMQCEHIRYNIQRLAHECRAGQEKLDRKSVV